MTSMVSVFITWLPAPKTTPATLRSLARKAQRRFYHTKMPKSTALGL
jgi:hypothetical protein